MNEPEAQLVCLMLHRFRLHCDSDRAPTPPVDQFWVHLVAAKGACDNVTEELFVLTLLLCGLQPCRVKVSINISQSGGYGGGHHVDCCTLNQKGGSPACVPRQCISPSTTFCAGLL